MYNQSYDQDYRITSSGLNEQGNRYDHRVYPGGRHGYHYSNKDGGYYYRNPDGSRYYNDGQGFARYTNPIGEALNQYGHGSRPSSSRHSSSRSVSYAGRNPSRSQTEPIPPNSRVGNDGSYAYETPDGLTYFNDGHGHSRVISSVTGTAHDEFNPEAEAETASYDYRASSRSSRPRSLDYDYDFRPVYDPRVDPSYYRSNRSTPQPYFPSPNHYSQTMPPLGPMTEAVPPPLDVHGPFIPSAEYMTGHQILVDDGGESGSSESEESSEGSYTSQEHDPPDSGDESGSVEDDGHDERLYEEDSFDEDSHSSEDDGDDYDEDSD